MAAKFVIAKGRSLIYKGRILTAGEDVTSLNLKHMEIHVKSGHVVKVGEAQGGGVAPEPPSNFKEPLKPDQDVDPAKGGPKLETIGKWALDPTKLAGKSIEQLNVMIAERDNSVPPFEKTEDAIGRLSADFKPAPAPRPAKK